MGHKTWAHTYLGPMSQHLAVKLHRIAERTVRQGHPWVFEKSIDKLNREGRAGDLAMVFGRSDNKLFAIGLYDPVSPVRIKVIHHGGPTPIDAAFFHERIRTALHLREPLLTQGPLVPRETLGETGGDASSGSRGVDASSGSRGVDAPSGSRGVGAPSVSREAGASSGSRAAEDAPSGSREADPEERPTTAYRLLFGENDGFPGLIADVYDNVAVLKLYSAIWFPWLELIVPQVVAVAEVDAVVLRLSRHLQQEHTPRKEGDILHGELLDPEVRFQEYGVRFQANVLLGHKTGFFLDHRANRHRIGQLAKGKAVLDVFSYAGGFSVHALAGGATEVTSVDASRQALELAVRNATLNPHEGKHLILDGDAFGILEGMVAQDKQYDIVVIDPPSFAKSEKEMAGALRKYAVLAVLGARLTRRGGLLVLASCSSRITADEFMQVHRTAFGQAGVRYTLEDFTQHDIDHPVRFPEGAYLKTAYYRMAE